MKILVCISKTPDTTAKISFKENNSTFNSDGVSFIMNPYDEWYALVRAVELVEANGGTCSVINVGPASNDIIIRKALAIGANDAFRVDIDAPDAYTVAANIADHAKSSGYDMIFTGKETIDYNGSEIGAMIAELLDLPYVSYANHLDFNSGVCTISRDIEGGDEICEVSTPLVLSASKGLAEQRIPNMKGIMSAKTKPLTLIQPSHQTAQVAIETYELPAPKSGVKLVDPENMDELVRLLHEEAKVL
ncbi:MAG: electron transfer flavoprotein subunit beta/FixA family protein [Saprospiraceae bacterium]